MPKLTRTALLAKGALMAYLAPKLAADASIDLNPILEGVSANSFDVKAVTEAVTKATDGKLAKDAKTDAVNAVPVEVAKATRGQIAASYNGTATLTADHEAQVAAKTTGVLKKLYVEEGMSVKEGQLLAELDDADTRSKALQAESLMHKAEATFAHDEAASAAFVGIVMI